MVAAGAGEALVALADGEPDPAVCGDGWAAGGDYVGEAGWPLVGGAASLRLGVGLRERSVAAGLADPVTGGAVTELATGLAVLLGM